METMRNELLGALWARMDRLAETSDAREVLDSGALLEAGQLFAASQDPEHDLEVRRAVGWLHWHRYRLLDDPAERELAETLLRPVHAADPRAVPDELRATFSPSTGKWAAINESDFLDALSSVDPEDLAHLMDSLRDGVYGRPPDHPEAADGLVLLSTFLSVYFEQTGDLEVLRESLQAARLAVASASADHSNFAAIQSNLSGALHRWYLQTDDVNALREAINVGRRSVAADPHHGAALLTNLSIALLDAFKRTNDVALLEEAVTSGRRAVDLIQESDPSAVLCLSNLGRVLQTWAKRTQDADTQAEAVRIARRAVAATQPGHPAHPLQLNNLASALGCWFDLSGDRTALAEAVEVGRRAVSATPARDTRRRGHRLSTLGSALQGWFEATDDLPALAECVEVFREAVDGTPENHPDMMGHLHRLSYALLLNYERHGTRAALHQVVIVGRRALAATPADHPEWVQRVIHQADGLRIWYEHTGDLQALDESIALCRSALETGTTQRSQLRSALVTALRLRCQRAPDRCLAEEAVALARKVVADAGPGASEELSALGCALSVLGEQSEDLQILEEAIDVLRKAADTHPADLTNLVNPLLARHARTGDPTSAEEAVAVARRALDLTPDGLPTRGHQLFTLGQAMEALHASSGDAGVLGQAVDTYLEAASLPGAHPGVRFEAGHAAGRLAMSAGRARQALTGFTAAVEILPILATTQLVERSDAEHWLQRHLGLAASAAACALEAGDADQAVALLEQGRGVLLDQALSARNDLVALREVSPELADRFQRLSAELDTSDASVTDPGRPRAAGRRHERTHELETLIDDIRTLPDFSSFLRPPTVRRLVESLRDGPVVLINASRYRCDALAVTAEGVRVIPLRGVTVENVIARVNAFHDALRATGGQSRDSAQHTLRTTLGWLWDEIAEPVLTTLGITRSPGPGEAWPRLWWVPVGPLSYLPLHAAGHHDEKGGPGRTVLDRVVSSYTPTIRAITHVRGRRGDTGARPSRRLVVSMPTTPDAADLPGARAEADLLAELLPDVTVLAGTEATHERVVAELRDSAWAHFACHAQSRFDDASNSNLLLHDHLRNPLSVRHLAALRLPHAELAFLSACGTSLSSPGLMDEAVHITAAFQLAGFAHVIGTLWTINDRAAVKTAREIYARLLTAPQTDGNIAWAVHCAVNSMRNRYRELPSLWAAHVHVGA